VNRLMHVAPTHVNGQDNSVAYMRACMRCPPKPPLRPDVAARAATALVVPGN
jgi:hypothetical protein